MPEVQAEGGWVAPGGILGSLVRSAERRIEALSRSRSELERRAADAPPPPAFAESLRAAHDVALIAEIKRASPSRAAIAGSLVAAERATAYARGGASALSVVTEPEQFRGSLIDMDDARRVTGLPILRKDFLLDELQLMETCVHGASAALLIARAVPPSRLGVLVAFARSIGLETLVEVRDEKELERALASSPNAIGINNRDLESLEVDRDAAERLLPLVPRDMVAIAESGISDRADVSRYAAAGADAVLVGTALSSSPDPEKAARALTGVLRVSRSAHAS